MQLLLLRLTFMLSLLVPIAAAAAPRIFYTDIVTGPNTGGENNSGAYLTLFGREFGATQGTSQVRINGVPVAAVKQWTDSKITVQPGAAVTSGVIGLVIGGTTYSDPAITFTVVPGKIFFVALNGNDSTGVAGDITKPFRLINSVIDSPSFVAGDHIVVRGGTWTDVYAHFGSFFSVYQKGGTAAAPIAIMGYPTETVLLNRTTHTRGIHSYNTPGHYVIANFRVNANGGPIGIGLTPDTTNVRVVNNEVYGFWEDSGGAAAIDGSGSNYRILGNHVHDNGGSKLYHAMYFDARANTPDDIEIAYNHIHHQTGGRGIQIYGDTGRLITNVRVHHNLIHNIHLDGILFGNYSGTGFQAYNNVVYQTADPSMQGPSADAGQGGSCIRFNHPGLAAVVYNNTFVDCALQGAQTPSESEGVFFDAANSITLRNNIVAHNIVVSSGTAPYTRGTPTTLVSSNNLWFGAGAAPAFDSNPQTGNPLFASAAVANFHLLAGSPAIDHGSPNVNGLVTTDFDGNTRPQGAAPDIGAFEVLGATPTLPTPTGLQIIMN